MDATSLPISSQPLSPLNGGAFLPGQPGEEGVRGADFANLLSHLMDGAGRQGLAAASSGLQSLPLSPNIEVITSDAPLPDSESLLAFARSQGLDDGMIQSLFPSGPGSLPPHGAAALHISASPLGLTGLATTVLGDAAQNRLVPTVPALTDSSDAPTLASLAALGGQALRALDVRLQSPLGGAPGGAAEAAAAQAADDALAQTAPQLLQDAVRLRLQPQEQLTRRLAALSGTGQQMAWGQMAASWVPEPGLLDLSDVAPETADALTSTQEPLPSIHPSASSGEAAKASAAGASAALDAAASTAAERAERYEQLAQRLGQALGQRLQSQIERGEWKVQMQVDPAYLGRIDMELDMRSGGLDAVFRSDNPLTRELIAQGLPRLRETLTQSGTAVANVWVQGDSSRQSGGNPTPGRGDDTPSRPVRRAEADQALEPTRALQPRGDGTAWDLLA